MGSLRDAPEMGLPFDLICVVTIGVHYLGRPLVQCTQYVKKWLPFNLICSVTVRLHYLERPRVRFPQNGYRPYMFSSPRTQPSKSGLRLTLYVQIKVYVKYEHLARPRPFTAFGGDWPSTRQSP